MIATIDLFEALKTRFGEQEAKIIVREMEKIETSVETKVDKAFENKKDVLATKQDIKILEVKIAENKADIIKWMVALILGLFIALIGSMAALIKLIH